MSAIRLTAYLRRSPFLIFLLVLMLSCTTPTPIPSPTTITDPSLMDKSWLTGEPCEAPCWYGMELGKTSKDEAMSIMESLSFIDPSRVYSMDRYWDLSVAEELSFYCKTPHASCTCMIFVNNTLVSILLVPNYSITFSEVVKQIGVPDFIGVTNWVADTRDCAVELIWLDRQMKVEAIEFYSSSGRDLCYDIKAGSKPPSDLEVSHVLYMLPEEFKDVPTPKHHYPWQGFAEP